MKLLGPAAELTPIDAASREYAEYLFNQLFEQRPRVATVVLDFGADDTTATATVTAPWASGARVMTCVPDPAGTADHNVEEAAVEGVVAYVSEIRPGTGFDVIGVCPEGTWGRYQYLCIG